MEALRRPQKPSSPRSSPQEGPQCLGHSKRRKWLLCRELTIPSASSPRHWSHLDLATQLRRGEPRTRRRRIRHRQSRFTALTAYVYGTFTVGLTLFCPVKVVPAA